MKLIKSIFLILPLIFISCKDPVRDVFSNYTLYEKEIIAAEKYFSEIKPDSLAFYIKFRYWNRVDFKLDQKDYWDKTSWNTSSIFDTYGQFHKYNTSLNDEEIKKALEVLNINKQQLEKLKEYLADAKCNSIENNFSFSRKIKTTSVSIGYSYPRIDLYGLDYILFESQLDTSTINEILKSCSYKKINNRVLVEYGGPAFGSNCFPDKK